MNEMTCVKSQIPKGTTIAIIGVRVSLCLCVCSLNHRGGATFHNPFHCNNNNNVILHFPP